MVTATGSAETDDAKYTAARGHRGGLGSTAGIRRRRSVEEIGADKDRGGETLTEDYGSCEFYLEKRVVLLNSLCRAGSVHIYIDGVWIKMNFRIFLLRRN